MLADLIKSESLGIVTKFDVKSKQDFIDDSFYLSGQRRQINGIGETIIFIFFS